MIFSKVSRRSRAASRPANGRGCFTTTQCGSTPYRRPGCTPHHRRDRRGEHAMRYKFDFSFLAERWPVFLEGAWLTIQLTVVAIVLGFIVGTVCAVLRVYGPVWVRRLVGAYVEAIRNTPLLVQIFIVYFGIASLGLQPR